MVTRILFDPRRDLTDGTTSSSAVTLEATPTGVREDGSVVVLPSTLSFTVNTAADLVQLAAPAASWAWRLVARQDGVVKQQRTVRFTDVTSLKWAELVDVDPATLGESPGHARQWDATFFQLVELIASFSSKLDAITAGAPGALDTFFEVATRFGLDQATTTALQALVAGKASPADITAAITQQAASDMATYSTLRKVAALTTTDGALVASKHNRVDATTGARTMTLPTGASEGTALSIEKADVSLNMVTVTGNIRGVAAATAALYWSYESLEFVADSAGSWWPVAGHKTKAALDKSYLTGARPEQFGAATAFSSSVDDTPFVQAALNAIASGTFGISALLLTRVYNVTTVTVNKLVKITGVGAYGSDLTPTSGFSTSSRTADCLVLAAHGCILQDFAVVNTAGFSTTVPTAGAGIRMVKGDYSHIDRVHVDGFWNGIQYDTGYYYSVSHCLITDPINYGLWLRNTSTPGVGYDHGDQSIDGNAISKVRDTVSRGTGIRWETGGGLRIVNNKINAGGQLTATGGNTTAGKFTVGVDIAQPDAMSTVDIFLVGNSIENCVTACFRAVPQGPAYTGYVADIVIHGNEFGFGDSATCVGIYLDGNISGRVSGLSIGPNAFSGGLYRGIYIKNVSGGTISPQIFTGITDFDLYIDDNCFDWVVSEQRSTSGRYFTDLTADNPNYSTAQTNAAHRYVRPFSTSAGAAKTLYTVGMTYSGAVVMELQVLSNGARYAIRKYVLTRSGASAVTATALETVDSATPITVTIDTATSSGKAIVSITTTDARVGRVNMRLSGPVTSVVGS